MLPILIHLDAPFLVTPMPGTNVKTQSAVVIAVMGMINFRIKSRLIQEAKRKRKRPAIANRICRETKYRLLPKKRWA
jgi:hypothetical protein